MAHYSIPGPRPWRKQDSPAKLPVHPLRVVGRRLPSRSRPRPGPPAPSPPLPASPPLPPPRPRGAEPQSLRDTAALALGRIRSKTAAPALSAVLGDPDPRVRAAAALALGRLRAPNVAERLEHVLLTDPAWTVRYAAAAALARFGAPADSALPAALAAHSPCPARPPPARPLHYPPPPP